MKKPYQTPRLITYGHVKEIVQGSVGPRADSGTTKSCWIAEALYGAANPRTLLLRAWITDTYEQRRPGWPLAALYRRVGEQVAALIRAGWMPRIALLPLFDALFARAFTASAREIRAQSRTR